MQVINETENEGEKKTERGKLLGSLSYRICHQGETERRIVFLSLMLKQFLLWLISVACCTLH